MVPVSVLGIPVTSATPTRLHELISRIIERNQRALILNVNINCINLACEQPWLHAFLNDAELVFCDGAGVALGIRILGHSVSHRITYADWIWQLAEYVEMRGYTVCFVGARPDVAQRAARRLRDRFPGLRIDGVHHGHFDLKLGSEENERVVRKINEIKPNILLVGLGMPTQERWLMENWDRLDANVALTGGAVFDYVSGNLRRAPSWMTDHGMEWIGRLIVEPRRLWRRYVIGNPLFLWRVVKQRFGWPNL
jgi:N-acetylglucosaminyldiphosphoundecaprenol N-acetyl-beta-D-mannosaminyltransferase